MPRPNAGVSGGPTWNISIAQRIVMSALPFSLGYVFGQQHKGYGALGNELLFMAAFSVVFWAIKKFNNARRIKKAVALRGK